MQRSRRVLSPRTPLALLQPQLAQFSRQASLTSAINRGIRRSRGLGSLESRKPTRPPRKTRQDLLHPLTRRTGIAGREGSRRSSKDSFSRKSGHSEYSGERYGRNRELPKWQARSGNARGGDQAQGSYVDQGKAEKDSGGRPNRKHRRATVFGAKTWSASSPSEHNVMQPEPTNSGELLENFTTDDLRDNGSEGITGLQPPRFLGSNRYKNNSLPKPIRRAPGGHEIGQENQMRRKGRDKENEVRQDAYTNVKGRSGTTQSRVKIPLTIPYNTAGSEFLYGTHVVKAALQSGRRKLYKLYMYQDENSHEGPIEPDNNIYKFALAAGVNVSKVGREWERLLDKMSDQRPHNGYVLEASPVPKLPVTALAKVERPSETFGVEIGHQSAEELAINSTFDLHGSLGALPSVGGTQRYPFLLMLDRIRDPGNLGSIIRSAYFLGAEAIAVIEHGTAPIGPIALKSSAGAAEHLPLLVVKNEHAFMRKSQENGWKFFAATSPDSPSARFTGPKLLQLDDMTPALQDGPLVLVLGSEEGGIRPQLQRIVNGTVGITSGRGSVQGLDSLNVGVAAALLMHSFLHGSKRAASLSQGPPEQDSPKPATEKMFEL